MYSYKYNHYYYLKRATFVIPDVGHVNECMEKI